MILKKTLTIALGMFLLSGPLAAQPKPKPLKKEISVTSKSRQAVELFRQGRNLVDNVRFSEAEDLFRQAIEADPNFALAQAYLGSLQPGSVGEETLKKAVSLAAKLPETERMIIEAMLADRQGNPQRSLELRNRLVELAPNDWHTHFNLGQQLSGERRWDESARHLEHAVSLNPRAGSAFNTLGYAYLARRENEKAIEAFRKYAAANPTEPNPQDSLAEALMAAGRFEEAEQAFREALRISPGFYNAWEGIAHTRFLRGQWETGNEAWAQAEAKSTRPIERAGLQIERAWLQFARGDVPAAMRSLEAAERDADRDRLQTFAFIPLVRAAIYNQIDQPVQALQQIELTRRRADRFPRSTQTAAASGALRAQIEAETKLGRIVDARQTVARLKDLAGEYQQIPSIRANAHFGEGLIALAEGNGRRAAEHFAQCFPEDGACGWKRFVAENMAGDRAAAEATRTRLLSANYRDGAFQVTVAKLR